MSNNFGTLNSALILQEALPLVFTTRPILSSFSMGFNDKNGVSALFNQQVITRTLGIPTVNNFGTGAADQTDTDIPVTLDQFKEIHLAFTPQEYSSTNRDLIRERAQPIAVAIANYIVDAVAALFTTANFPLAAQKTVKGAGWDYTHLTFIRGLMAKAGTPDFKRFYIANTDVWTSLLNDPLIVAFFNNQQNAEAIRTGQLPQVAGLGLAEYPALPANGANLVAFAGTPDSVVYASRVPKDPQEVLPGAQFPGNIGVITEPKSQFSIMVNEWIDPATLKANVRLLWMQGVAKGQTVNGQLITSQ